MAMENKDRLIGEGIQLQKFGVVVTVPPRPRRSRWFRRWRRHMNRGLAHAAARHGRLCADAIGLNEPRRWWWHPYCWLVGHDWLKYPGWPLTCGRCGWKCRY